MPQKSALQKYQQKKLLKASLLKPTNLLVLATGFIAGKFSFMLIPVGIMAYGVLCYLDFSSKEFAEKVLRSSGSSPNLISSRTKIQLPAGKRVSSQLATPELKNLQENIFATKRKIEKLYESVDHFTRELLGDFSQTEELVKRSDQFLHKAQNILEYLASEDIEQIQRGITALQEKIEGVDDNFSKRQYQQALDARNRQLKNLKDIQQLYDRLVSQVTNISLSLESLYSRMMKLKAAESSPTKAESDQVSVELHHMLQEMEQLDTAINDYWSLPD